MLKPKIAVGHNRAYYMRYTLYPKIKIMFGDILSFCRSVYYEGKS